MSEAERASLILLYSSQHSRKGHRMTLEINYDAPRSLSTEVEAFVFQHIPKGVLGVDLQLFTAKWFDYRHMTAYDATAHYMECYAQVYRRLYRREVDKDRAEHLKLDTMPILYSRIVNGDDKLTELKRRLTSYWRGRQVADALGMPYEIYIEEAITARLRYWNQRYLPKPGHLYDDHVIDAVQKRWEEIQEAIFMTADHPAYLNQNYVGAAQQNDYHEWLFAQLGRRNDDPERYADLINEHALPYEKVQSRLGERFDEVCMHL